MHQTWLTATISCSEISRNFRRTNRVIAEIETSFEATNKPYYIGDLEKLENRYNWCITLEGMYVPFLGVDKGFRLYNGINNKS